MGIHSLSIAGLVLVAGVATAESETATVLPLSEGPDVLTQCSRSVPTAISGFWEPSSSIVEEADRVLLEGLRTRAVTDPQLPISWVPTDFIRQYIGIARGERRELYVNVAHNSILESWGEADLDWRTNAIVMCDGGHYFWGITYDPGRKRFSQPRYNGWL